MNEVALWKKIKDYLPGITERIENICSPGMPDVVGIYKGITYWIELKICRTIKFKNTISLMQPTQPAWHFNHAKEGAIIFILIKHGRNYSLNLCVKSKELSEMYKEIKIYKNLTDFKLEFISFLLITQENRG